MKRIIVGILFTIMCVAGPALGADVQINVQFNAATGDNDFDDFLRRMNVVAGNKINVFISDLSTTYNVPAEDVRFLIYEEKVQPADAFMILQLVRVTGKPIKKVVRRYHKHRGKGWGAVAYSYGIRPGTQKYIVLTEHIPSTIYHYKVVEVRGSKGSKGSKGWHGSKGSKGKKHKKYHKYKHGSKGKGSKGKKHR